MLASTGVGAGGCGTAIVSTGNIGGCGITDVGLCTVGGCLGGSLSYGKLMNGWDII